MLTLGIHTASSNCSAAILDGETILAEIAEPMQRGHDQRLPDIVSQTARSAGIRIRDLGQISVCVGPGSFTGIRVGVAFARGLALANSIDAFGVTSPEGLMATPPSQPTFALIPAKKRLPDLSFWAQSFGDSALPDPAELSVAELKDRLGPDTSILSTREGSETLADLIPDRAVSVHFPNAAGIALWSIRSERSKVRSPTPIYVREPDAIPAKPLA